MREREGGGEGGRDEREKGRGREGGMRERERESEGGRDERERERGGGGREGEGGLYNELLLQCRDPTFVERLKKQQGYTPVSTDGSKLCLITL